MDVYWFNKCQADAPIDESTNPLLISAGNRSYINWESQRPDAYIRYAYSIRIRKLSPTTKPANSCILSRHCVLNNPSPIPRHFRRRLTRVLLSAAFVLSRRCLGMSIRDRDQFRRQQILRQRPDAQLDSGMPWPTDTSQQYDAFHGLLLYADITTTPKITMIASPP